MILFITRKHPPSVGGMQKLSQSLTKEIGRLTPTSTIYWGGSTVFVPFFVVYAFLRAVLTVPRSGHIKLIHLSDALLAPLGLALKTLLRVPVVVTIHGLDVTYDNRAYQWLIPRCLRRMDKVICVSSYTRTQCIRRGVPAALCEVIPNGVNMLEFADQFTSAGMRNLQMHAGRMIRDRKVLLTVGRLIERKGVVHFLTEIMPRLLAHRQDITYLIVGEGPQRDLIETRIASLHLGNHVCLLGRVDDDTLRAAYSIADLFIMPNIPVQNDIEGFGLVALEAAAAGRYVVASKLDGIPEAIVPGENGTLLDPLDTDAYVETILELLADDEERSRLGQRARAFARDRYSWDIIARRYLQVFLKIIQSRGEQAGEDRRPTSDDPRIPSDE
ncbi:MAG TPA: glycosyltransferase family 4 protein [Chloroflexia bacterium]|nr:glycosyltransferase family 4 protein [Chloroflexia bacterium]